MLNNPHTRVVACCVAGVFTMGALSFAAVPLYRLYCQVTGFGGTTQRAVAPSDRVLERTITVRFDSNVSKELPWRFEPVLNTMDVKLGQSSLAFYRATNLSDRTIKGTAMFNVAPDAAGIHFNKIECFCFTEQTLAPGETVDMPVSFFVDAKLADDPDARHLRDITLSYTFYPVAEPEGAKAAARDDGRKGG